MWFLIVTALVVSSTALEEDDYCEKDRFTICFADGHPRFPENEQEFDETCPIMLNRFRCMQEYASKCDPDMLEEFTAHVEALQDVCSKDSSLHEAIAKNVECIRETVIKECSGKISEVIAAYRDSLNVADEEDWKKLICMGEAYAVTCVTDAVSEPCGSAVRAAILEMAHRADYLGRKRKCPRNRREEIIKDIPTLEISSAHKLLLEEILLEI